MEAPKCRTCGERHWGLCLHEPKPVHKRKPVVSTAQAGNVTDNSGNVTAQRGNVTAVGGCPVCAARRAAAAKRTRRHRARADGTI